MKAVKLDDACQFLKSAYRAVCGQHGYADGPYTGKGKNIGEDEENEGDISVKAAQDPCLSGEEAPRDITATVREEKRKDILPDQWSTRISPKICAGDSWAIGNDPVDNYAMELKVQYAGKSPAPIWRMFLHTVMSYGLVAGQRGTPEMLFGMLADPFIRGAENPFVTRCCSDGFRIRTAVTPPGGENELPARQSFAWCVGSAEEAHWPMSASREYLNGLFTGLVGRIAEEETGTLTVAGQLWPLRAPRESSGRVLRPPPGTEFWRTRPEIVSQTLYFCDTFHGSRGLYTRGEKRIAMENIESLLVSDSGRAFSRVGVLVSGSPEYLRLARRIRLGVMAKNSKGESMTCQVELSTLNQETSCCTLTDSWVASVPLSAPFITDGGRHTGNLGLELLFGDETLKGIRRLEDRCVEPEGENGDFLIITPYLLGEVGSELM